jgi:alpha-glucosidase
MLDKGGASAGHDWWRGAVIYQIYLRSFADGNADGVGDLAGATERLGHVAALGADAVWLSPFYTSPMKDFGYDVADYTGVDPSCGTLADFDAFVDRAHALGLKVLIDQVWSHSSDAHPWFVESRADRTNPRADWYVWADAKADGSPPNNWLSVFGGSAWTWEPRRRQYYLHHFLSCQPQFNLRQPGVIAALFDAARFWLARGVDGFRLDAIDFLMHDPSLADNPPDLSAGGAARPFRMQRHLNDMLHGDNLKVLRGLNELLADWPGRATLGEVSSEHGAVARCTRYTAAADRLLDMAYTLAVMKGAFSADEIAAAIAAQEAGHPEGWLCWAFSNHDVERVATRWHGGVADDRFSRLLMAMLLMLKGSICIYQGEELGLPDADLPLEALQDPFGRAFWPTMRSRDGARTPMPWSHDRAHGGFTDGRPWLPVTAAHLARAVDLQAGEPGSMLETTRRLLAWRHSCAALVRGAIRVLPMPEGLLGIERTLGDETVRAIFNLTDEARTIPPLEAGFREARLEGLPMAEGGVLPPYGIALAERELVRAAVRSVPSAAG